MSLAEQIDALREMAARLLSMAKETGHDGYVDFAAQMTTAANTLAAIREVTR